MSGPMLEGKMLHRKTASRQDSGFTLVEITIAVLILAGSLTVLLGLQSSVLQSTYRDQQKLKAMLLARRIFSAIEVSDLPLNPGTQEGSAARIIESIGDVDPEEIEDLPKEEEFQVELVVENWGLPGVSEEALKRVQLFIRWGETNREQFLVTYFIPFDAADDAVTGSVNQIGNSSP